MNNQKAKDPISYRPDVDGLRALAILLVVVFHAFPTKLPGGYVGVDVFFVISGFLISSTIFRELQHDSFSLIKFYGRRFRRIAPALILVLFSCLFFGWFLLPGVNFESLGKHLVGGATYTSNILLAKEAGYFDQSVELKPLLHLWSLGLEEQFYLIWPVLLIFTFRRSLSCFKVALYLFAASFLLNVVRVGADPISTFYFLPTRLWELMMGGAMALSVPQTSENAYVSKSFLSFWYKPWVNNLKSFVAVLMLTGCGLFFSPTALFPGFWALIPTVGSFLIISAGQNAWINKNIFSWYPVVLLGLVSYPFYLWHWPLLAFPRILFGAQLTSLHLVGLSFFSLIMAWLTWKFVEIPVRSFLTLDETKPFRSSRFTIFATGVLCLTIAIAGYLAKKDIIVSHNVKKSPLAFVLQKYAAYDISSTRIDRCFLDTARAYKEFDPICYTSSDAKNQIKVLLLGDSHAAHLYPGLSELFKKSGIELMQMNGSSCPPVFPVEKKYAENCRRASEFTLIKIKAIRPDIVIIFAQWDNYFKDRGFDALFTSTLQNLRKIVSKQIIIVGPFPEWFEPLPKILETRFVDLGLAIPVRLPNIIDPASRNAEDFMKKESEKLGVSYISLMDSLCNEAGCLVMVGDNISTDLITYDGGHLTGKGASFVAEKIVKGPLKKFLR